MITPQPQIGERPEFSAAEQLVFDSMTALLDRAGLGYQGQFVEVNGIRIHYLDYGSGPPVLLLHGGGAGSAIWFRQIAALAESHRVIAPDHPVFGLSSQEAYEAPLVDSIFRYLTGFMDALGLGSIDVAGLSMGAQGALSLAINSPERINRLIVIGSAGLGKAFPMVFRLGAVPLLGRFLVRPNRWGQDNYFKTMEVVDSDFFDAGTYKRYAYDVTLPSGHSDAMRASLEVIADFAGQKSIFTDDELRSIRVSTLAIWGEHDKVIPVEHGYRLAKLVPNSSLHIIANSAHVPLLDNPDQVNDLLTGYFGSD
jgi:pimeloyl-ACP methyl ester carboxylesterase